FSSRRRHTRFSRDWSSDVCSSDLHGRAAGCLGQVHLEPGFPGEGGGHHEEQQQDEDHIDQGRQTDLHVVPLSAPEFHALLPSRLLPSARSTVRSPCTTSTSLMASCSMPTTSSSTRRCR